MTTVEQNAEVVSQTPGRLRLRLHPQHRHAHRMRRMEEQLEAREGVDVEVNPTTGSVVVKYDHRKFSRHDLFAMFRDAGVIAADVTGLGGGGEGGGASKVAGSIMGAMDDLDERLGELLGRKIDLRVLVPAGLTALGLWVWYRTGTLGFSQLPAYLVLWYAAESFLTLVRGRRVTEFLTGSSQREPA